MKRILFLLTFSALFLVTTPLMANASSPYTDTENHWSREDAEWAYENGILFGTSETEFSPDKPVSRAMAITALYRMDGSKDVSGTATFDDVSSDSYYYDAVLWGVQNKVINGTSASTFRPNAGMSRQDFATMLYRYDHYQNGLEWITPDKPDNYHEPEQGDLTDELFFQYKNNHNMISWYAKAAMDWAVNASIVNGNNIGRIYPLSTNKRSELAAMLRRYIEREDTDTERLLFDLDISDIGSVVTRNHKNFYERRIIESPEELNTLLDEMNQLTYIWKEPVTPRVGWEYLMNVYNSESMVIYDMNFYDNGIRIGDIHYHMVEESGIPYRYLPDGWFEKWFET